MTLPDSMHQRAKVLSSSFSGDGIFSSKIEALSGFTSIILSTSSSRLSKADCCLLHPTNKNVDRIVINVLLFICLS